MQHTIHALIHAHVSAISVKHHHRQQNEARRKIASTFTAPTTISSFWRPFNITKLHFTLQRIRPQRLELQQFAFDYGPRPDKNAESQSAQRSLWTECNELSHRSSVDGSICFDDALCTTIVCMQASAQRTRR